MKRQRRKNLMKRGELLRVDGPAVIRASRRVTLTVLKVRGGEVSGEKKEKRD